MVDLLADRAPLSPLQPDRPNRKRRVSREGVIDLVGAAVAALAAVWLLLSLAGVKFGFGYVFCWAVVSYALYGVLVWRRDGILLMKERLATVSIWTGGVIALVALLGVVVYVVWKGFPEVYHSFPQFLVNDTTGGKSGVAFGVGPAIVGTLEQVGIAALISIPIAFLTATYLVESRSVLSRLVQNIVDAMTGTPSIIAGLFIYILWVFPHGVNGKSGFVAAVTLSVMMIPVTCRAALEVIRVVPGSLREAALAIGAPQWRVALRVVLPTARAGLITAAILGVARTAVRPRRSCSRPVEDLTTTGTPSTAIRTTCHCGSMSRCSSPRPRRSRWDGARPSSSCASCWPCSSWPAFSEGAAPPVLFVLAFLVVGASEPTGERMKAHRSVTWSISCFVRAINSQRSQIPDEAREDTHAPPFHAARTPSALGRLGAGRCDLAAGARDHRNSSERGYDGHNVVNVVRHHHHVVDHHDDDVADRRRQRHPSLRKESWP